MFKNIFILVRTRNIQDEKMKMFGLSNCLQLDLSDRLLGVNPFL